MLYFSDFGTGGGDPLAMGALVYIGADLAHGGGSPAYDMEAYDNSYHDTGVNPERLTIPSGITRGRLIANTALPSKKNHFQLKNGASFMGRSVGYSDDNGSAVDSMQNFASAIVSVSAADYFTTDVAAVTLRDINSWLAFEPIGASIKGALVKKTGTQSISSGTTTTLTWDAEEYDTDGFHDNATNNSRLTVPSGVTLVRISACVKSSAVASGQQAVLTMPKGGSSVRGGFAKDIANIDDTTYISAVSAVLAVSASDYFEAQIFYTGAETVENADDTWFQIEEVPATRKYAVVYKSGTQAISAATLTILAFGAELADTDGFHDNSTDNSRLTVPSGCTRARLSFNVKTPSTAGEMLVQVKKNGSASIPGLPSFVTDTAGTDNLNGFGAWVDVTPGDYFELEFRSTSGLTLGTDNETWFCIEAE